MKAKAVLPILHATKWIAFCLTAMIGLTATAFAQGQGSATDSVTKLVERGDLNALRSRLSSGANPNESDGSVTKGWTPLMEAASSGNIDAARLLLDSGAAIEAKTQFGKTALDVALASGKLQVAELLSSRGAKGPAPPGRAEQMIEHLADLSSLLQQSSFFLIGEDGFMTNRTLRIGVDRTTGTETVETDEGNPSLAAIMGTRYQFTVPSLARIELDAGSAGSSEHTVFQKGADGEMHPISQPETRRTVTIRFLAGVDVTVRDPARGTRNDKTSVLTLNTLNCTDDRLQQLRAVIAEINGLINAKGAEAK